jgi:solute carrier family 25 (mitochondrial folate transporter), member 32
MSSSGLRASQVYSQFCTHLKILNPQGAFTAVCTNPLWVVKTRMLSTSASKTGAYKSTLDGIRQIHKFEGFKGFYRGLLPSFFGVAHGALQFTVYEELKRYRQKRMDPRDAQLGSPDFIVLSGLSKLAAGAITYPHQVLRARLQTYEAGEIYRGLLDVVYQIAKQEGIKGFYKGLMPNMLRVVPSTCVTFLVYENTKKALR